MARTRVVGIIGLILVSAICGCCPETSDFAKAQPRNEDMVGTYLPTEATKTYIKSEGKYPEVETHIKLSADGTFEVQNMPDWWSSKNYGTSHGQFESMKGTWKTTKHQEWWAVQFSAQSLSWEWNIFGQKPPYLLYVYLGDADEGHIMAFERTNQN